MKRPLFLCFIVTLTLAICGIVVTCNTGCTQPQVTGLINGTNQVIDRVESYTAMRSVAIQGNRFMMNTRPFYLRMVLDQGYWPESLMAAPTDDALVRDIELGLQAGFNGARLHQKVFEERYLYHADRLGYLPDLRLR